MVAELHHFIGGKPSVGTRDHFGDVFNPAIGEIESRVPQAGESDISQAVEAAKAAQPTWAAVNPQRRGRVIMRFVQLLNDNMQELAELLSREHGKMVEDSKAEIQRGLEVFEFAIGVPHLLKGEFTEGAGPGIDMYSLRQPVGIGVGITPFNFPAMIPLWMAGPAIACGNAFILKPSEKVPSVPLRLAELLIEAGLPEGIFSVVNGGAPTVEALVAHPGIDAVSFVGSTAVARKVYAQAASAGKRAQCFGGAKNHLIVMPDADIEAAVDGLVGSSYGSAGERCMAISVSVPVGEETADRLVAALQQRVERLRVGPSTDNDAEFGPLISAEARDRVLELVESGLSEGAELVVDGRGLSLQGHEKGFFVGPCLFDRVTPEMEVYRTEVFGPVLAVVRAADFESALALPMSHEYGNGASIYTRDGNFARDFASRINIGMIGVNVPVPAPLAYYGFGGWKASAFGDLNQHGVDSIRFWTRTKTITARWRAGTRSSAQFSMPAMD